MEDVEILYEPHDINCEGNGCMWKISLENVDNFDVTHMQYVMDFLSSKMLILLTFFAHVFHANILLILRVIIYLWKVLWISFFTKWRGCKGRQQKNKAK